MKNNKKTFYIVSNGCTFSKHKTKKEALIERELNQNDGYFDANHLKSKWYIKKLRGSSAIYGDIR